MDFRMGSVVERVSLLSVLAEMTYPEYRERHIFTARLRLLIFAFFTGFYALLISPQLPLTHPAILTIAGAGLVTAWCYYHILIGRWLLLSFLLEVVADMIGITATIYLMGGIQSDYYLLYLCYCIAAGLFYNYRVAGVLAIASLLTYFGLVLATLADLLPAMAPVVGSPGLTGAWHSAEVRWISPLLLGMFLAIGTYAVRIAQQFSLHRERSLEARNRELLSLQRIGGMIRGQSSLQEVVERMLQEVMGGLDLAGCLLLLVDPKEPRLRCYAPKRWAARAELETALGHALGDFTLPLANTDSGVIQQLSERRVLFRHNLGEIFGRMEPVVAPAQVRHMETHLDLHKVVVIPLIAEGELLGALIGLSTDYFVEEGAITTLEVFADQAALVLRVTMLIDALRLANQGLIEANRVKGEFLATMSHELRTPLTAIIGFSELLIEGAMGPVTTEQRENLREILNNGANLLELINNILDLARMESGRMTLTIERFDLAALLARTHRTVGSLLARKQLHFALQLPAPLPPYQGDERRIQQVVLNLLGNAIKFTPEGGRITMRAQHFARLQDLHPLDWTPHVRQVEHFQAGGFYLHVHDSGIGIPTTHLQSIFEMFKQVDSSVTRRYEGTGLGLALVRQLVELHGGAIWADSDQGMGTTFHCVLPDAWQPETAP